MPLTIHRLISRLSLRQLQVFQAVYSQQGYRRAADALGLTQPAVSAQIKQLEQALGQPLFEYVGRKLYCTPAGERVALAIDSIFGELQTLQADVDAIHGQLSGDIRLTIVNTAQLVLPYLLKGFLELHPEVSVHVKVVNRRKAIERLSENRDDLVIMGLVPSERPLTSIPFLDNEMIPVCHKDHPLAQQQNIKPETFFDQSVILRELGSGTRLAIEQHCLQQRLRVKPYMELGSNEAVKHGVLANLGVAVLPRLGILPELQQGTLKMLDIEGFPLVRSWCLVHPSARNPSPASAAFVQYVQENLDAIHAQFTRMSKI
ncbi:LysR substrate-binding domain-containing protein [Bermanella sp. R86510]|uniref:LysR substrate-binding domain-containing protein n=1 Tax=unclassified Bermanella TaxID=2627862 RepID=UPI0037C62170